MLNLGLAIKMLRKVTKTSQRKLASEVDVTVTHISHIENNKADPSINLLRKIARNYANIGVEDVQQVLQVSGHTGEEDKPCRICKVMASKTIELSED